jgi:biotin carboxyl carrier protein
MRLSRRTVAASAGVTNPRVQQIVDRDAGAPDPADAGASGVDVEARLRRIAEANRQLLERFAE